MNEDGEDGSKTPLYGVSKRANVYYFLFCFPHPPLLLYFLYSWRGILFTFLFVKCLDMGIFYTGWWKSAAGYYIAGFSW